MKKWYYKLKESESYNVLILAVIITSAIRLLISLYNFITSAVASVQWGADWGYIVADPAIRLFLAIVPITFVLLACREKPKLIFVSIISWTAMAIISEGWQVDSIQCIITAVYWFGMTINKVEVDLLTHVKRITIILLGAAAVVFIVRFGLGWIQYGLEDIVTEFYLALSCISFNCFNPEVFLIAYLYKKTDHKILKNILRVLFVLWIILIVWYLTYGSAVGMWSEWGGDSLEADDWSEWTTEEDEDGNTTYYNYDENGNGSAVTVFEFEE